MFEDCGQDFLQWDFDSTHTIISCRPFQGSVWIGRKVELVTRPRTGTMYALLRRGDEGQDEVSIHYPVFDTRTRPSKFVLLKTSGLLSAGIKYRTKTDGWSKHIKNAKVFCPSSCARAVKQAAGTEHQGA